MKQQKELSSHLLPNDTPLNYEAEWIWAGGFEESVDTYAFFRKKFTLEKMETPVILHITASSCYSVFINGKEIGRGPNPSSLGYFYVDSYPVNCFLKPGGNIIAVLAWNSYLGLHSCPRREGGLLAQIDDSSGKILLATDSRWKVNVPECWSKRAPRLLWTLGFAEYFNFNLLPENWQELSFHDNSWDNARQSKALRVEALIPTEIKPLKQKLAIVNSPMSHGYYCLPDGIQGFDLRSESKSVKSYALTSNFFNPGPAIQAVGETVCDDEFTLEIEEQQILCQKNGSDFYQSRLWEESIDCHGFHCGHGRLMTKSEPFTVKPGWNGIRLEIIPGPKTWGLLTRLRDPFSQMTFPFIFSADKDLARPGWKMEKIYSSEKASKSFHILADDRWDGPTLSSWQRYYPELKSKNPKLPFKLSPDGSCVFDFRRMTIGYPILEFEASGGEIIDISYGEKLDENGKADISVIARYGDRLTLKQGINKWEAVSRKGFRYLQLTVRAATAPITVQKAGCLTTSSAPDKNIGTFTSSDEILNQIYQVSRRTLSCCMQDHFVDCPTREWGQYQGDALVEAIQAFYLFGDYSLSRKGLRQFARIQMRDGSMRALCPSGTNHRLIDYSLVWIEWLHAHFIYTGDLELVRELLPSVRQLLEYFEKLIGENGLVEIKDPDRHHIFLDHAPIDKRDTVTGLNAWYYKVLITGAKLAEAAGERKFRNFCLASAESIKNAANRLLWSEKEKCYVDCFVNGSQSQSISQATNILALYSGLVLPQREKFVMDNLFTEDGRERLRPVLQENPYFKYYVLDVMYRMNRPEWSLQLMKNYWGRMLSLGADVWWETFNGISVPPKVSMCHAWSGAPGIFIPSSILGITPASPGFKTVTISPHFSGIEHAAGSVPTSNGAIKVKWFRDSKGIHLSIKAPKSVKYSIKLKGNEKVIIEP